MTSTEEPSGPPGPPARPRHFRSTHGRRLRRWPRRLLVTANVLVFVLIVVAVGIVGYAVHELGQIHKIHDAELKPAGDYVTIKGKKVKVTSTSEPPFTVLLVGSDSRAGATHSGLDVGNTTTNSENLSDSIILLRVAPATKQAALLSIPRDLWVSIPGMGMGKINAAFSGGDPTRLTEVIENDLGIPVNHFAEVSFDSFEQIADDIGGVEQYFPTPAKDLYSGLVVPTAGCVNLKGAQALAFVRSRHYEYIEPGQEPAYQEEPESDLGRIQRQQAFIKNAINKIKRSGDLSSPLTLARLVNSITKNLTVDNTFSDSELVALAEDFRGIDANSIPNTTYPVQNYDVDGTSALSGLPTADAETIAQFMAVGTVKTPAPTTTSTTAPAKGSSPASTATSTTTSTTVPHATISVEVENGSGVANQAGTAASDLEGAGYSVSGSADAASFSYTANEVEYGPDGAAAASTLQASLAGGATLTPDPSLTGDDLILITGSSYDGIATAGASSSTGTTTTTTLPKPPPATGTVYGSSPTIEADSSSFYEGVYIPPGRLPGQKVETCGN